jgi:hypothetical protein
MSQGNWYRLLSIVHEGLGYVRIEPKMRLLSCPHDGERYSMGPDGKLYCRYDGYRPDGTYVEDFPRHPMRTRY